jgi:Arm DNA-binding domain
MASIKAKITKRLIDALKPAPGEDLFVWDTELRRFGIRVKPSAATSYLILYRVRSGKQHMFSFAKVGTVTPVEARAKARRLLAEVDDGGDPKERRTETRAALTVVELCSQYLAAARAGLVMTRFRKPKRPSTIAIDEGRVARHIVPLIGSKVAARLSRPDLQRLADAITAGKTAGTFKTKARGKAVVGGGATCSIAEDVPLNYQQGTISPP